MSGKREWLLWTILAVASGSVSSTYLDFACTTPPAFWCDDERLAERCGVLEQCARYNATVHRQKLRLTVIYEALCPDCQEFLVDTLHQITWLQWEGWKFIELQLVPYGNAHSAIASNGSYQITCQHGPDECWLNRLHSCAMDVLQDAETWLPLVACMENARRPFKPAQLAGRCMKNLNISGEHRRAIAACQNGPRAVQLEREAADVTDALWPDKHDRVPWIAVNGVSLKSIQYLSQYGHQQPVLYYALRRWFRGGRDPKSGALGKNAQLKAPFRSLQSPVGDSTTPRNAP